MQSPVSSPLHHRFLEMVDLASERVGAKAVVANDEFFAEKENLLKAGRGIFIEGKYTNRGKWMDGWETRRRRTPGHDWCIIKILPGEIHGVVIDTNHFLGNFPESASIEWAELKGNPSPQALQSEKIVWHECLPKTGLKGGSEHYFETKAGGVATHVRLNIFPDGGVARLRVYGLAKPNLKAPKGSPLDLALITNGARVITCNDMFFGPKDNLIMPGRSKNMGDGWETKRKRQPGFDWLILKLAGRGTIKKLEIDTNHFKGNYPESFSIEAWDATGPGDWKDDFKSEKNWKPLLARTKLKPHFRHYFQKEIATVGPVTHLRLNIFPDGGISRLRAYGDPA